MLRGKLGWAPALSLAALLAAGSLAACGSGGEGAGAGKSDSKASAAADTTGVACAELPALKLPKGSESLLGSLPDEVQQAYNRYPGLVAESPYANFKPKGSKPFTIGFNNSFSGNAWRAAALKSLKDDVAKAKAAGLVDRLVITDSNNKTDVQIQQMRSLIQQKVDLIISIPGSPNAMNATMKEAHDAGIPVVTLASPVTTPHAINVDTNGFLIGAKQAVGLAQVLGGKGNVITIEGIPGTPGSGFIQSGGEAVLKQCKDMKIVTNVVGQWSQSVAKTEMLKALATHPGKIDGVWEQGSMAMGAFQALEQAGRPLVPVTDGNPDENSLAYWHDKQADGYKGVGSANSPGAGMDVAFKVGMRTLLGQGPKVTSIVIDPPLITNDNVGDWYKPSFTTSSDGVAEPPPNTWLPDAKLDSFFATPGPVPGL
jgi:ribose transport system substrate-binding protein